jgi:hypothetical protein
MISHRKFYIKGKRNKKFTTTTTTTQITRTNNFVLYLIKIEKLLHVHTQRKNYKCYN